VSRSFGLWGQYVFSDGQRLRRRSSEGFTLLEALLAVALLAAAGTIIFSILGEGVGRTNSAAQHRRAVMLAESLLARAGNDIRATTSGRDEAGLAWRVTLRPYTRDSRSNEGLPLAEVIAQVEWTAGGSPRTLQISTLRPVLP
jgi:general secretion pathway protein I